MYGHLMFVGKYSFIISMYLIHPFQDRSKTQGPFYHLLNAQAPNLANLLNRNIEALAVAHPKTLWIS